MINYDDATTEYDEYEVVLPDSSIFYPDASPESTSVDGWVRRAVQAAWSTIRSGAGDAALDSEVEDIVSVLASATTDEWTWIKRAIMLFDASALAGKTVSGVTFSFYTNSKTDDFSDSVSLVSSSPNTNTALINSDYGQLGTTKYASDTALSSISTGAYTDLTLNATGIAAVQTALDGDGIVKLGMRMTSDNDNSEPTWASGSQSTLSIKAAQNDQVNAPKLTINYDSGSYNSVMYDGYLIFARIYTDILNASDTVIKGIGKIFTDTLNASDSLLKSIGKVVSDTVSATESFLKGFAITLTDNIGVSEILKKCLNGITTFFYNKSANSATLTNKDANSASLTNKDANTATLTNKDANSATFSNKSVNSSDWTNKEREDIC